MNWLGMARDHKPLEPLKTILFHRSFPVDIRHNSKINREMLAAWAAGKLK